MTETEETGDLHREHWTVPVRGLTPADPDGTVQAIARPDGTVILNSTCGHSRTTVRLDVCRAAQLSTGIWEAAGTAQHLTGPLGDDPPAPPHGSADLPAAWYSHPSRHAPPRDRSPKRRRRLPPVNQAAARDARRTIGLRIRRTRETRDKSLQVISGLAGMSPTTLHHIEHGRRDLTLSEIVALATALEIDPTELIILPIRTPTPR
ncbi:MAG: helix-turn-helix domain-containing protein [Pseudonocardiaceae bacterium]